jgi:hypothetical protein
MQVLRWPPLEVVALERRLNELAELVGSKNEHISEEVRSWLARLLLVRSCGYLEQVVVEVQRAYVRGKSGGLVRSFALTWLERTRNPTPDTLLESLGRFDSDLRDDFQNFLEREDSRLHRELSFLVDRRNKIAHGMNESITPRKSLAMKEVAVEIADWFILRLRPAGMS